MAANGFLFVAVKVGWSTEDLYHLIPVTEAILDGDLGRAYPVRAGATSPPGYPLLAALPVALLLPLNEITPNYAFVGLSAPLWLAAAVMGLARMFGVVPRSARELAVGLAVLAAPAVPQSVLRRVGRQIGYFHPEDLIALALVLVAVAAASRSRGVVTGAVLGVALLTRQWAILAALPIVAFVPRSERLRLVRTAAAVAVVGVAPFLLTDPAGTWHALSAPYTTTTPASLIGHLGMPRRLLFPVARVLPVLGAVAIAATMARRWKRPPQPLELVGAVAACLALRPLFDPALFTYYLAPVSVMVVVMAVAGVLRLGHALLWLLALTGLLVVPPPSDASDLTVVGYAALLFSLSAITLVVGLRRAWSPSRPAAGSGA